MLGSLMEPRGQRAALESTLHVYGEKSALLIETGIPPLYLTQRIHPRRSRSPQGVSRIGSRGRVGKSPIGVHPAIRVASLPLAA